VKRAFSRKNLWEMLPAKAKSVFGSILAVVPPYCLLGRSFKKHLRFLEEAQWWSADRAREYQLTSLRSICTLAYERTSYYRQTFSSIGLDPRDIKSIEDFCRIPIIDRSTLRDNLDKMCTVPVTSSKVDYISTAGTSGTPLKFYIGSDRSQIEYAYLVSSWQRAGFQLGMTMAVFRGRIVPENSKGLHHEYDPLLKHHFYSNFYMNDQNMRRYMDHVRTVGPCFLHVYPSSVANLARFLQRSGIEPPENIVGIIAESENVYPEQRQMVEKVFERRYFSSYGHTEKLVAAAECEKSTNYHVWPTYGYFELLDDNGNPVTTPGQRGKIVGTGFINTVVPFIRYRTGDYATYVGGHCKECGRAHPIIADIRGHNIQENLIAFDGSLIPWSAVNVHDDTFENVLQFQFYQDTPGRALLRVVPAPGFNEKDRVKIQQNLGRKFDNRLKFEICMTDSVPLSKSGKAIYVDQQIQGVDQTF
jgi:phenylacetate-CoA ligase